MNTWPGSPAGAQTLNASSNCGRCSKETSFIPTQWVIPSATLYLKGCQTRLYKRYFIFYPLLYEYTYNLGVSYKIWLKEIIQCFSHWLSVSKAKILFALINSAVTSPLFIRVTERAKIVCNCFVTHFSFLLRSLLTFTVHFPSTQWDSCYKVCNCSFFLFAISIFYQFPTTCCGVQ